MLSRGVFEYDRPEITVSEEKIQIQAQTGELYGGSFEINSVNGFPIKAMIFSSNHRVQCQEGSVIGAHCVVNYIFDAKDVQAGTTIQGSFCIVSNGGELNVPYEMTVCKPYFNTSIGTVRDMRQFTELARINWHEALKCFRSPDFTRVLLVNKKHEMIYNQLMKSRNQNIAMEEFLCALRRKKPVEISVEQTKIYHENLTEALSACLVLEKDTWGYQKISVSVTGSFIQVYKKELTTEDFLGSTYELEYVIDPATFATGNNYGKITIQTLTKTIEIPVNCMKAARENQSALRRSVKTSTYDLFSDFLKLRMNRISKEQWIRQTREAVDCCRNNSTDKLYELFELHFSLLAGEIHNAAAIIEANEKKAMELRRQSVLYYDYFLYLTALYRQEPAHTKFVLDTIQSDYNRQYNDWQLLWCFLDLASRLPYGRRFAYIKAQFVKGCNSSLLYWEAISALNQEPALLRDFSDFEIALMAWGMHHECLKPEVIYQFAQLASRSRSCEPLALKTLMELCEIYENKEILQAVCTMLIRGKKTDVRYNRWYALAIKSSLRIPGIYEYYMYSLDEDHVDSLPYGILLYFKLDNHMPDAKKAFIYHYVIRHREIQPSVYAGYEPMMKAFAFKQLKEGKISRHLAALYKHFITPENLPPELAAVLPQVLFKYEVLCDQPQMNGVAVVHRETGREVWYPLVDGAAYVDIYMDEYHLVFTDREGSRYCSQVTYTMDPLMDHSVLMEACFRLNPNQPMVLLHCSEQAIKYQRSDPGSIDIYQRILKLEDIRVGYRKNVVKNLLDFYYDTYEGETLEKHLMRLDIDLMGETQRNDMIEYYIQRGLFEKAVKAVKMYGYRGIKDERLMRLASRWLRSNGLVEESLMTQVCCYVFRHGKYDQAILEYLVSYYNGPTARLYEIWKAAGDFEVNASKLEEKLVCQILFTENFIAGAGDVFDRYYHGKPRERIVRAYLAFVSYRYLLWDQETEDRFFGYVEIELDQLKQVYDVCALALLKYYAASGSAREGHDGWIQTTLSLFMERGIVLPFFTALAQVASLPAEMLGRVYVQYAAHPGSQVTIVYERHEKGEDAARTVSEEMQNMFGGLFVKAFTMFSNEEISYYFVEHTAMGDRISGRKTAETDQVLSGHPKCGKDWINQMLMLWQDQQVPELKDKIEAYEAQRYISRKLFTLLQ